MTKARAVRVLFYLLGLLTLAFGLTLNTKTGFGVSPIVSVAYTVSSIWELNFGNVMLAEYVVFAALEIVLHILMWRQNRMSVSRFRSILIMDLLQLPLTLLFTRFMNLFSTVLPDLTADCSFLGSVAGRLLALLTAVVCTGVGAVLILDMRLIATPGDGIVQVLADFFNAEVGLTKNCFDAGNLLVSISLGLFLSGRLTGVGLGTAGSMVCVGRVMALFNRFFLEKLHQAAGMALPALETPV